MEYYISGNNGKYSGPFKKEDLIKNGVTTHTMIWRQGLSAWLPAKDLAEIADIFTVPLPPPLASAAAKHEATASPPPLTAVQNNHDALAQELERSRMELEELKKTVITLENANKKIDRPRPVTASKSSPKKAVAKSTTTSAKKDKPEAKEKKKAKTRYSFPVASWLTEACVLMACVIVHFVLGITNTTTYSYIYLDIVGAALCAIAISLGMSIKKLNNISYKEKSPERIKADKLSYFNGLLVSVTAAIGFLIILVQSAHYVYVS